VLRNKALPTLPDLTPLQFAVLPLNDSLANSSRDENQYAIAGNDLGYTACTSSGRR